MTELNFFPVWNTFDSTVYTIIKVSCIFIIFKLISKNKNKTQNRKSNNVKESISEFLNCRAWTCSGSTKAYVLVYGVTFYDPNYQYVKLISINCVLEVTVLFNEKLYYYKKRLSSCIETKMWKRNFFKKAASGS